MRRPVLCATAVLAVLATTTPAAQAKRGGVSLTPLGSFATGVFDASAAEIVQHDPDSQRLFTVNAQSGAIDVLDARDPQAPRKVLTLSTRGLRAADGSTVDGDAVVNSVSISDGVLAVAVQAGDKVQAGWVAFFRADGSAPFLGAVRVGSLPDMVTWTPDGDRVLVANEAEPADDFSSDPEGSVSVIDVPRVLADLGQDDVRTARFTAYEGRVPAGVRVYGPDVPVPAGQAPAGRVARNLEPEYIAVDRDAAYVTLQEANTVAVLDIDAARFERLLPLGTKDWSRGAGLDASDRDDAIRIAPRPVRGLYLPDAIATYRAKGRIYFVTANEGDAREWGDYVDTARLSSKGYVLCPDVFPNAAELKSPEVLGRLNVSLVDGLRADGCYDRIHTLGGRSFSIWAADGTQVFDSGSQFEQVVAAELPVAFNANNDDNDSTDSRSDDKGPEPEGLALGDIRGRTYAFVGLERAGGVMTYDVTDPARAQLVDYVNNRDVTADAESAQAGDLGPEGLAFVSAKDSPTREPLLVTGNEVSGTTTVFAVR